LRRLSKEETPLWKKGSATLIRINPKDAGIETDNLCLRENSISIYEKSLFSLEEIDKKLDALIESGQKPSPI